MTLEFLTSDLLADVRHGFFTRKGGASSGVFEGLNCGLGSSDQRDVVKINRARVAEAMGVAPEQLKSVHQVHSPEVVTVDRTSKSAPPKADGLITNDPSIALSILTADCQPVLFADAQAGVIGAAHAGWKGAVGGVLEATIDAMVSMGAERDRIKAAIGPCISQSAYEVGPDFFEEFIIENPENARFFAGGHGDRLHFDLAGFGLHRLRSAGVEAEWTRHCTFSDAERFYSYRRTTHAKEADYGRLISTIRL